MVFRCRCRRGENETVPFLRVASLSRETRAFDCTRIGMSSRNGALIESKQIRPFYSQGGRKVAVLSRKCRRLPGAEQRWVCLAAVAPSKLLLEPPSAPRRDKYGRPARLSPLSITGVKQKLSGCSRTIQSLRQCCRPSYSQSPPTHQFAPSVATVFSVCG